MDFLDKLIAERRASDPEFAEMESRYAGGVDYVIEVADAEDLDDPVVETPALRAFSVHPEAGTLRVTEQGQVKTLADVEVVILSDGEVRITGANVGQWVRRQALPRPFVRENRKEFGSRTSKRTDI